MSSEWPFLTLQSPEVWLLLSLSPKSAAFSPDVGCFSSSSDAGSQSEVSQELASGQ